MNYEILKRYINDFPNLKSEYDELVKKGYEPSHCAINVSFVQDTTLIVMRVLLKNLDGKSILISQSKAINDREELDLVKKKIVSIPTKIRLSAMRISNEEFKKSFKGYNCEEVDVFLDLVAKDYYQMEKLINTSKQNEIELVEKEFAANIYNDHPKIRFTELDVAGKEFNKVFRGYNCMEVDRFIDMIVEDYNEFKKIVSDLE